MPQALAHRLAEGDAGAEPSREGHEGSELSVARAERGQSTTAGPEDRGVGELPKADRALRVEAEVRPDADPIRHVDEETSVGGGGFEPPVVDVETLLEAEGARGEAMRETPGDGGLQTLINGLTQTQAALDSRIVVNGFAHESATNSVTTAVDGLTFNLLKASEADVTTPVGVTYDKAAASKAVFPLREWPTAAMRRGSMSSAETR